MSRSIPWSTFLVIQAAVLAAFGAAYAISEAGAKQSIQKVLLRRDAEGDVAVPRKEPLTIAPRYDRPDFVSDEELAAVLERVVPRFRPQRTPPNYVEHAIRIWGTDATFHDPQAMSGRDLMAFLTDHGRYAAAWGNETAPLILDHRKGLAIRFGNESGASVHHDHWLASLTEAGVPLDTPVYGPGRRGGTIDDVLQESLRDFRLDERETEWTAMAFGLWLPPVREWTGSGGRRYSFDLLAERLMRGHQRLGVCCGTHRVYSLIVLLRLDDEFDILTSEKRGDVEVHLQAVRDLLIASQWDDGRWPSNWADGATASATPIEDDLFKHVIATGHHLEWLALAPAHLHPPDDQIRRAARWIIDATTSRSATDIMKHYTYYSHAGNALALWRHTRPGPFWEEWQRGHPYEPTAENSIDWARIDASDDSPSARDE